jgi:hypothetical protein
MQEDIMKADTNTEMAVTATLNQIHDAYARRNSDTLTSLLAPDADVLMFGTGVDEKRVGVAEIRAQAERDWSQTDVAAFEFGSYGVSAPARSRGWRWRVALTSR